MSSAPEAITRGFLDNPADLAHLQLVDARQVTALLEAIAALDPAQIASKKLFITIGTGGTLCMRDEGGIRRPDLDSAQILAQSDPDLAERFTLLGLDAFKIDSAQMDYRHVQDLAIILCYLWQHSAQPLAGFLILHGTDTLAYSGAALSLMLGQGLPFSVVYTAAQKPIQEPMSDAGLNIRNALYLLDALHARGIAEVVSVMGDRAFLSSGAVKIHDTSRHALSAPLHPPVTDFTTLDYPLKIAPWLKPARSMPFTPTIWRGAYSHTLVVRSALGLDPSIIARQVQDAHVRAVLLYSYGAGTLHPQIIEAVMQEAAHKACPVFVVSPIYTHYKVVYETAKMVTERGATPLYMTLPAALAKIEIALRRHPDDLQALAQFMRDNYVGEIPDHER